MRNILLALVLISTGTPSFSAYSKTTSTNEFNSVGSWKNGKAITKVENTNSGEITVLHTTLIQGNRSTEPMLQFTVSKLKGTDSGTYIGKDSCSLSNFKGEGVNQKEVWKIANQRVDMSVKCVTQHLNNVLVVIPSTWDVEHNMLIELFAKSAKPIMFQRTSFNTVEAEASAKGFTKAWYSKRLEIVENNARNEDIEAQYLLGTLYGRGYGVTQSYENAAKWFSKAAEQGLPDAQYRLAALYVRGYGVTQSYENSAKWLNKAAEQGLPIAQYWLGTLYERGDGVTQSYENAAKWFSKAAEQDLPIAQYSLGTLYELGYGVTQSDNNAAKWYSKAVELDPENAMFLNGLAWLYVTQNQLVQAKPYAEKAYQLASSDTSIADTYGYYLLKSGQNKAALEVLKEVYGAIKNDPAISLHYAESLIANNQSKLAKEVLSEISTEDPKLILYKNQLSEKVK
jgi:TPR repeat protein